MHNRLRLLKGATALMYFGTLLAGLAGHGWAMVAVFTAIFLLWSVILRPHLWPSRLRDLAQGDAVVALAALVASQILLVVLCFAVGRGIGGVLGMKPALPVWLPLALSFLAVPLSRLIWNPQVMAENEGFDPLLHRPLRPGEMVDDSATAQAQSAPASAAVASAAVPQDDPVAQRPVSSPRDP